VKAERYRTELLRSDHKRDGFSCGVELLDGYFRHQIGQDQRRRESAPFVMVEAESGGVLGFYTLSSTSVEPSSLPTEMARRLGRYRMLPAALIGRLAVDSRFQGKGIGKLLLLDALSRCLRLSQQIGSVAVLVDAKDEAAVAFYEHFGFTRFRGHELRLFIPMATISRLMDPGSEG
jgi:GNAT superfamily N-acetyltransferase